jgi:L-lactate dehydrogenase complex protein LldE
MRISLFITCVADTLFPRTGVAVVRLLERLGHEVDFPPEQTCCGQMHRNSGHPAEALGLARRFVRTFGDAEVIVAPSASCVAMVREHYASLAEEAGDRELAARVAEVAPRVLELSELLVGRLGVTDVGATYPHRVVYHPTCHSMRLLRVGAAPVRLLREVRGLELAQMPDAAECCGFGGTFAINNPEVSTAMLADKVDGVLGSGAEVCTALDRSCLMHIGGMLARRRAGVRVTHLAEILASTAP